MSIKEKLCNVLKNFIDAFISENISYLEEVGSKIADYCSEGIDHQVDLQLSLSGADQEIKTKIAKKAKYNGLFRLRRGFNNGMQKNLEKFKGK